MRIKPVVESLCRKYNTRDPLEIAALQKIIVLREPLGEVRGYYSFCYRQQFIHINERLEGPQTQFTAAHELGHAILHPRSNTPFLRAHTLYSVDKLEVQANRFAVNLLFDDEILVEIAACSIDQIACALGVSLELAEYRMSGLQTKL